MSESHVVSDEAYQKMINHLYWLERSFFVKEMFDALQLVIEKKVDANTASTSCKTTILLVAAANIDRHLFQEQPCFEVIRRIIDCGADVNLPNHDGKTALMFAASNDTNGDCIRLLLNSGANIDTQDKNGWSALMYAAERVNENNVKILLNAGAKKTLVNAKGRSAWDIAILNWMSWKPKTVIDILRY